MAVTYKILHEFDFTNGSQPYAGLAIDAQGNLIGTTFQGATDDAGSVFEIASDGGAYDSFSTLLSFPSDGGTYPLGVNSEASVFIDSSGNLIGTTTSGGAYGSGTIFELTATHGADGSISYVAPTAPLVSFQTPSSANNYDVPSGPDAAVIMDSKGDLFSTTAFGGGFNGADYFGTVYEVPYTNGSYGTPISLVQFNGDGTFTHGYTDGTGRTPVMSPLVADANGDLFGTAEEGSDKANAQGLPYDDGVVFEIAKNGGYEILASFTGDGGTTPGAAPEAGLTMDSHGNLFGTTYAGNASGKVNDEAGTVFEIPYVNGSYGPLVTIQSFDTTNMGMPEGGVIVDAVGNIFGTTTGGGAHNHGAVFEIPHTSGGYGQAITLVSFTGNGGAFPGSVPEGTLIADSAGDIFGTTEGGGGPNGNGTVFELTNTGYQTACYCRGTLITTSRGEVAVEDLAIGDAVLTISGALRPIKWIGQRSYSGRFLVGKADILPVCFKAGSLDDNTPTRDLWVSPHHAMYLDGLLIEAKDLINGASIFRGTRIDNVEYFHIELDSHDVIFAEGAYSETYFDDDNRGMFHNAHSFKSSDPAAITAGARYYAPRVEDGFHVEEVRNRLQARASASRASTAA